MTRVLVKGDEEEEHFTDSPTLLPLQLETQPGNCASHVSTQVNSVWLRAALSPHDPDLQREGLSTEQ